VAALASVSAAGMEYRPLIRGGRTGDANLPVIEFPAIWRNEAGDFLWLAGLAGPLEEILADDTVRVDPLETQTQPLSRRASIKARQLNDSLWLQGRLLRRCRHFFDRTPRLPAVFSRSSGHQNPGAGGSYGL